MYTGKMKELREEERPYEKCLKFGAESLSNTELLAVLLRNGVQGMNSMQLAQRILDAGQQEEELLNIHHMTKKKLLSIKGIGEVKAIQIQCLSELAKRLAKATASEGLIFNLPSSIARYYMEDLRHQKQEQMKLLMLNTKSRLLGEADVSKGTVNSSVISPRELFIEALEKEAVFIILLHNHPSGDPTPSDNDILFTKRVKAAGDLIGIELLDHIIIGNNCYISMAEEKLM